MARSFCHTSRDLQSTRVLGAAAVAVLALVLAVGAVACGGDDRRDAQVDGAGPSVTTVSVPGGSYQRVGPGEFESLMTSNPSALLLNVHIPYAGEIDGTDAFLPFDEIAGRAGELPADPAALVLVYCQSGRMSSEAAATLVGMGFSNVVELEGGMVAWQGSGRPLSRVAR